MGVGASKSEVKMVSRNTTVCGCMRDGKVLKQRTQGKNILDFDFD